MPGRRAGKAEKEHVACLQVLHALRGIAAVSLERSQNALGGGLAEGCAEGVVRG